MKTEFEMAKAYQTFESFRIVANEALGGSSSSNTPHTGGQQPVESFAELEAFFTGVGGKIG